MKSKDTLLLEEAYQTIYEANFLTKAIDKGKEIVHNYKQSQESKPVTFEQSVQKINSVFKELAAKKQIEPQEFQGGRLGVTVITPLGNQYQSLRGWELTKDGWRYDWRGGWSAPKLFYGMPTNRELPDGPQVTGFDSSNSIDVEHNPLTDRNLNSIVFAIKKHIDYNVKFATKELKDKPREDAKRKTDFEAKRWASSPQGQTGIRSNSGMGVDVS